MKNFKLRESTIGQIRKGRKQIYKQLLPVNTEEKIIDQFNLTPLSILNPRKDSKTKWEKLGSIFNDGEVDERKGYGNRGTDGIAYMSEFHSGLAEDIIEYWSLEGARVVDPFAGRVTRAVVSTKINRQYYGYDVSPTTVERAKKHFEKLKISPTLYLGDGTKMDNTEDNFADLVFTCPPYFDIEKYESAKGQLSDIHDYKLFMKSIDNTAKNCFRVLKDGAFCVWVVADFRKDCELVPFHMDVTNSFINAGFINHDLIVVENISSVAQMQFEKAAAKRYTAKIHEFILVFRKPGEYIIPSYCKLPEKKVSPGDEFFT